MPTVNDLVKGNVSRLSRLRGSVLYIHNVMAITDPDMGNARLVSHADDDLAELAEWLTEDTFGDAYGVDYVHLFKLDIPNGETQPGFDLRANLDNADNVWFDDVRSVRGQPDHASELRNEYRLKNPLHHLGETKEDIEDVPIWLGLNQYSFIEWDDKGFPIVLVRDNSESWIVRLNIRKGTLSWALRDLVRREVLAKHEHRGVLWYGVPSAIESLKLQLA
jgi:hypothetical protein